MFTGIFTYITWPIKFFVYLFDENSVRSAKGMDGKKGMRPDGDKQPRQQRQRPDGDKDGERKGSMDGGKDGKGGLKWWFEW